MGKKLSIEQFVSYPIKRLIHGGSVGSDVAFDFRAWQEINPCEENRFHVICVEYVKSPKRSYSSLC